MKKANIIKKNDDFSRILHEANPIRGRYYDLYLEKVNSNSYHFGFSTGKKVGNAVTRNKIRRQTKSITDKREYINGFNCIIMVKKRIIDASYLEMQEDLLNSIDKLNIIKVKKI